jgi:HAD superfamily hydrolase (TIGR01490 family)
MQNKRRIVIFDFCETLVDFQTADAFVDYAREHLKYSSILRKERINLLLRRCKLTRVAEKLTSYKCSIEKRIKLWQLKGISKDNLTTLAYGYYKEKIKPHLIERTNKLLQQHQQNGDEIWLISGGYGIYLQYFKEEYKIDQLISSNIGFRKDNCTGRMAGLDCMHIHKVELLKDKLSQEKGIEIVASYSDSISDIPILGVAKQGFVVSRQHQTWGEAYGFKEIIWT